MASKTTPALLPFPTTLIVVKGCPSLNVAIREHWTVKEAVGAGQVCPKRFAKVGRLLLALHMGRPMLPAS